MNPLYCWLMRKHTRFKDGIYYLRTCIPTLTIQTGRERYTTRTKIPRPRTISAQQTQVRTPHFHPDPYLRHCFDQTKGYEGEGPEWQGDDLSIANPQPDYLTTLAFINADGACVHDDSDATGGPRSLDTVSSVKDILAWNVNCVGIGDAQQASDNQTLRILLASGTEPIWPDCRWIRSPLPRRPPGTPGGTCMGLSAALAKRIVTTYELHSPFGWLTGVMLHGKNIEGTPTKLAIITVYCPLPNRTGGAWNLILDRLKTMGIKRDPAQQFYHELTELVCEAHKEGANVIIGGDFNTPYDAPHRYSADLEKLLRVGGLEHVLSHKHPDTEFTTYVHSDHSLTGRTCPDGVYASIGLSARGITRIGVPQEQYFNSRHRPIVMEINLLPILGAGLTQLAPNTDHLLQPMLPRLLTYDNQPLLVKYSDSLEREWRDRQLMERVEALTMGLEVGWRGAPPTAQYAETTTHTTTQQNLPFDKLLSEIESTFVQCELEHQNKIPTQNKSWPNGWSDELVDSASAIRKCVHVIRMARTAIAKGVINGDYLRKSWENVNEKIEAAPPLDNNPSNWHAWTRKANIARRILIKNVGTKWRKERRTGLTEAVQKRDQLYEDNKLKKYIKKY